MKKQYRLRGLGVRPHRRPIVRTPPPTLADVIRHMLAQVQDPARRVVVYPSDDPVVMQAITQWRAQRVQQLTELLAQEEAQA